jgi:hypothetical protein
MKKFILSIFTLLLVVSASAQSNDYRRPGSIGVSFFLSDFQSAAEIKKNGLGSVIRSKNLTRTGRMNPGLAFNYIQGLSNHVDFSASLGASFVDYPIPNQTSTGNKKFLLETTANLNLKLLTDNFWVVPYVDLGVGISKYTSHYAAIVPMGVGLQFNLAEDAFFTINSQYRVPVTESAASHLYHALTFYGVIGQKKK